MTTELAQPSSAEKHAPGEITIIAARGVLFWEHAWPAMLPALGVAAILIMISLFGVWRLVPGWLHGLTLGLGALVFASLIWRDLRGLRWPARRTALARLEQDGHAEHAPLQALDDAPFDTAKATSPLWLAHIAASAERARKARLAGVRPAAEARDPYGFRFIALGLITIGFVAAGADWRTRLAGGFTPGALTSGGAFVADLWIEPPAYTGKAPIYLLRAGQDLPVKPDQIDTPYGARLVAQINGRRRVQLRFITQNDETRADFERDANAARTELALTQSGLLQLRLGADEARWPIAIIADDAPAIAFTRSPATDDQGLLTFSFTAQDDYGIDAARLELRLDPDQQRPLDAPAFDHAALSQRRQIPLNGGSRASLQQSASLNLQSDPWAGLQVIVKVVVEDGAGQTGETKAVNVTLPARKFFNPLAKTVIEQRQTLAIAAEDWRRVGRSFDAVTMAPEVFFDDTKDYLLLRAAFWRVMRQDGDGFEDAVEKFWPLALQLEDEALELARQRLEAAEEALRQAIERSASDTEISRLVEELRQAMNDYLTALAGSGQTPEQAARNSEQLNQSDLDQMLDAIGDLAREGASNAARQMLSDLENLLNNLRVTEGGAGGEGQSGAGAPGQSAGGEGEAGPSGETGELIGRQRELADEAFERGQSYGENGDDLAAAEDALGANLDDLIDDIEGGEADPDGDAARALGQARNDMREAEQALSNGDFEAANDAMARAIENLRDGAKRLAGEEMRQARQGRQGRQGEAVDPLGRPAGEADGDGVKVPEETDAARTRAVIEKLRRRLAEPGRSEEEIDYLERLLERF